MLSKILIIFSLACIIYASGCSKNKVTVVSSTQLPTQSNITPQSSPSAHSQNAALDAKMRAAIELWDKLRKLKPKSVDIPVEVKNLVGKYQEVGGFYIINEATVEGMTEFMLTPIAGGCIHVPPPPAQFIIQVTMEKGKKAPLSYGPVLVKGILEVTKNQKDRVLHGYQMKATAVEPLE